MKNTINLNLLNNYLSNRINISVNEKEIIDNIIQKSDFSLDIENSEESKKRNFWRRVAFLTQNLEDIDILIRVEGNIAIVDEGIELLYAYVYKGFDKIPVILTGDNSEIKSLFNINVSFESLEEKKKEPITMIDWKNVVTNMKLKKEITLNSIKNIYDLANVPRDYWDDYNFFKESLLKLSPSLVANVSHTILEPEILTKVGQDIDEMSFFEHILELYINIYNVKRYLNYLNKADSSTYVTVSSTYLNISGIEENRRDDFTQKTIHSKNIEAIPDLISYYTNRLKYLNSLEENVTYRKMIDEKISKEQKFLNDLKEIENENIGNYKNLYNQVYDLFKNKLEDKNFLLNSDSINILYAYCRDEIKEDLNIINKLISVNSKNKKCSLSELPNIFFNNMDNLINYWNIANSFVYDGLSEKFIKKLSTKKNLLQFLSKIEKNTKIYKILEHKKLPKKLVTDEDVIIAFLDSDPQVVNHIVAKIAKFSISERIVKKFIEIDIPEKLPPLTLFNLQDTDVVKKAIKRNQNLILSNNCPEIYKTDANLLKELSKDILIRIECSDIWKKITGDDISLYKEFLAKDFKLYNNFDISIRKNENILKEYLSYVISSGVSPSQIDANKFLPKEVFVSRDMILKLVKVQPEWTSYINDYFWNEKKFILEFAKLLDENDNKYLRYLPTEIINIFKIFDVTENYEKFMLHSFLEQGMKGNSITKTKKMKI